MSRPPSTMQELFDECAAIAVTKQRALARRLGATLWRVDLDAGTLVLDGRAIEFQLVGTQSELSGTFLWAVADRVNRYPEQLLRDAAAVWAYGNANRIAELTTAEVSLAQWSGEQLAMIASTIVGAVGHLRLPVEDVVLFVLVRDASLLEFPERPALALHTTALELQLRGDVVNHRRALMAGAHALRLEIGGVRDLEFRDAGGDTTVAFGRDRRVVSSEYRTRPAGG